MQASAPKREIIDAEFEVIDGPLRPGDRHPTRKRWVFTGRFDKKGVSLWYREPIFSRKQIGWFSLWLLASPFILVALLSVGSAAWDLMRRL